jgi:methionyl-tRNA synthetase
MKPFYITTPLYYVNDKPHLGSAYSTVEADVLNRYNKLFGRDTHFLTGVDEHGQKVEQAAKARGKSPQEHCDELAQVFQTAWHNLNIQEDVFFRTTDDFHKKAVQKVLQDLWDSGEIYEATYEGWYCVSEEIFYTEKELVNGKTPTGKEVVKITEKNYFFRMSKYQAALIEHIEKNPKFIQPTHRRNEILSFLKNPLSDLCISRPKSRLSWGIEIPFDKDYVTYVWFDALLNYANGVGLRQTDRNEEFRKWWVEGEVVHIIGKDILMTHAVYWSTMLLSIGVPLPETIFAHGWILNKDNEKMSKSRGSVMDPVEWVKLIGADSLRYFLISDVPLGNDTPVSHELIINRVNNDLANNLGNLLSRATNLIGKFFDGKSPGHSANDEATRALIEVATATAGRVQREIDEMAPHKAVEHVRHLLNETNRFLEEKAPWKMAKTNLEEAGQHLYTAVEVLRIAGGLLEPVMPLKMKSLLQTLGVKENKWENLSLWGVTTQGTPIQKPEPLFPRIEIPE